MIGNLLHSTRCEKCECKTNEKKCEISSELHAMASSNYPDWSTTSINPESYAQIFDQLTLDAYQRENDRKSTVYIYICICLKISMVSTQHVTGTSEGGQTSGENKKP